MKPNYRSINMGLLGLGVVGSGIVKAMREKRAFIAQQVGCPVNIRHILVKHLDKERESYIPLNLLATDPSDVLDDPEIHLIVEVMGGETPALEYIRHALIKGKSVVTANKEVIAKHGHELSALAADYGAQIYFEASVGGGVPILRPLIRDLAANDIQAIRAIINGTTNYILTKMTYEDMEFTHALEEAQELGYAEADPTNDVEGIDATYKLAILASLAFRAIVPPQDVYREGINVLTAKDFRYARELGYVIKLMAIARKKENQLETRVHPTLIPQDAPLAKVDGVLNAVEIEGDLVDKVVFHGRGAGSMPTTSAVVGDVIDAVCNITKNVLPSPYFPTQSTLQIRPISELITRYYIRTTVSDSSGVLAQMATILGNLQISIASVIQKETYIKARTAELVITTHPAREKDVQQALRELQELEVVRDIGNVLRIEE